MTIQYIILGIILAAAVAYAAYRIVKAMNVKSGDPCYGCALRDACQKNKRNCNVNFQNKRTSANHRS